MSYSREAARIAAAVLIPDSRVTAGVTVVDLIEQGTQAYAAREDTFAVRSRLLRAYPNDEIFPYEADQSYLPHIAKHAVRIGERALHAREHARRPEDRKAVDVLAEPTILAVALGTLLVHEQKERIGAIEAQFGAAGGKKPLLPPWADHHKNGPLQRLVDLKCPESPYTVESFVRTTNSKILVSTRDAIITARDLNSDYTATSITHQVAGNLVTEQTAAERRILHDALQAL